MASYPVAAGKRAANAKVLVANVVDDVDFADDVHVVEVLNEGGPTLYVTVDGSAPTVAGDNTFAVPGGTVREIESPSPKATVVQLVSSGTPTYSVTNLDP